MSGKKFADAIKKYDRDQQFTPTEALSLVKSMASAKFDETVDVAVRLGVDPRKADQMVRGTVALPSGTGKNVRIAVFAAGEAAQEARDAGADLVGADDLANEIQAGNFDFDVAIASPDMMRVVSRLGKVLGPKGLMPSPKAGTVTPDVAGAVKEYAAGKQEYRNDDGGNVHGVLGKLSFSDSALADNLRAFLEAINKARPAAAKGVYIKKCVIAGCMTAGVQVSA